MIASSYNKECSACVVPFMEPKLYDPLLVKREVQFFSLKKMHTNKIEDENGKTIKNFVEQ